MQFSNPHVAFHSIKCDQCSSTISGDVRYKCLECLNYFLCSSCEYLNSISPFHPMRHVFAKIYTDEQANSLANLKIKKLNKDKQQDKQQYKQQDKQQAKKLEKMKMKNEKEEMKEREKKEKAETKKTKREEKKQKPLDRISALENEVAELRTTVHTMIQERKDQNNLQFQQVRGQAMQDWKDQKERLHQDADCEAKVKQFQQARGQAMQDWKDQKEQLHQDADREAKVKQYQQARGQAMQDWNEQKERLHQDADREAKVKQYQQARGQAMQDWNEKRRQTHKEIDAQEANHRENPQQESLSAADYPVLDESEETKEMKTLVEMGFTDRKRNEQLLDEHHQNLDRVLEVLAKF